MCKIPTILIVSRSVFQTKLEQNLPTEVYNVTINIKGRLAVFDRVLGRNWNTQWKTGRLWMWDLHCSRRWTLCQPQPLFEDWPLENIPECDKSFQMEQIYRCYSPDGMGWGLRLLNSITQTTGVSQTLLQKRKLQTPELSKCILRPK